MVRINRLSMGYCAVAVLFLGLTACSTTKPASHVSKDDAADIDTQTNVVYYLCEGLPMDIQFHGEEAVLNWEDKEYRLTRAVSASGAYYLGEGVSFWSEKDKAAVEVNDLSQVNCQLIRVES